MAGNDFDEVIRLQTMLWRPGRYNERRIERLCFLTDRRFEWQVEQQIRFPIVGGESEGDPCTAVVSLGIYPKTRLPDLKAFGPDGEQLPVLSKRERTLFLGITLASSKEVLTQLESGHLTPDDFRSVVSDVADIVGAVPSSFEEKLTNLKMQSDSGGPTAKVLGHQWDAFEGRISALKNVTHVLAIVGGRSGRRTVLSHTFSEELPELRIGEVVKSSSPVTGDGAVGHDVLSQHTSDSGHPPDLTDGQAVPLAGQTVLSAGAPVTDSTDPRGWRAAYLVAEWLPESIKKFATMVAQGFCLYPTTAHRTASNAGHCASYYFLVETPPGAQVDAAYWEGYVRKDGSGRVRGRCGCHDSFLLRINWNGSL